MIAAQDQHPQQLLIELNVAFHALDRFRVAPKIAENIDPAMATANIVAQTHFIPFAHADHLGLATLHVNKWSPWRLAAGDRATLQLREFASQVRLESIQRALSVFYLDSGSYPSHLSLLGRNGYLSQADTLDPWGRPYGYSVTEFPQ